MAWLYLALVASVMWGLDYLLAERILKALSSLQLLLFKAATTAVCIGLYTLFSLVRATPGASLPSYEAFKGVLPILLLSTFCSSSATFLTLHSIRLKNATLTSLVELSYPLFTALFAYLLFKQPIGHPAILLGGVLIGVGTGIIFWYS